jgi:hypothetical protein
MTAMKLQKLIYYCQAWHLAWEGRALFPEAIQALGLRTRLPCPLRSPPPPKSSLAWTTSPLNGT